MPRQPPPGPRLSRWGVLLHPPGLACPPASWIGESTGSDTLLKPTEAKPEGERVDVTYYSALQYGEHTIHVGDVVWLTPMRKGQLCEICRVMAFYEVEDEDNPKVMTVMWFWAPKMIKIPSKAMPVGESELFFSSCEDAFNSVDAIERCAPAACVAKVHVCSRVRRDCCAAG